jgi:hypothetical protein
MNSTAPSAGTPSPTDAATPGDTPSPTAPPPSTEAPPAAETPEKTPTETPLADEVLAKVRSLPDYVTLSTLYAEKSQADPDWPASDEGKAVGQYLQTMRSDAQAVSLQSGDEGKGTLVYTVGGIAQSSGVRTGDIASKPSYRQALTDALAIAISGAPRPAQVTELLKQAGQAGGPRK